MNLHHQHLALKILSTTYPNLLTDQMKLIHNKEVDTLYILPDLPSP